MASDGKDLPNLKICIDNTDEISGGEGSIGEESDVQFQDIAEDDMGQGDDGEVEEKKEETHRPRPQFQESLDKKVQRAKRFGIPKEKIEIDEKLASLYDSLGLTQKDIEGTGERGMRLDALHLRGVDDMSTKDIMNFFQEYGPSAIEWIDDTSCNVVWLDKSTAAKAMCSLSKNPYEVDKKGKKDGEKDRKNKEEKTAEKEKMDTKEEGGEEKMEEDDDNFSLNSSGSEDEEEKKSEKHRKKKGSTKDKEGDKGNGKQDREPGELSEDSDDEAWPQEPEKLEMPPGKWRVGLPYSKAKCLFLRFATKADKKQAGAERRSNYYRKYGNPSYGGVKGLVSESRKRKFQEEYEEPPPAEIVDTERSQHTGRAQINYEDDTFDIVHEEEPFKALPSPPQKERKREREKYSKDDAQGSEGEGWEEGEYDEDEEEEFGVGGGDEEGEVEGEEEDEDLDLELERLLAPPPKKRTMRMYADDEEETKQKKVSSNSLPPQKIDARDRILHRKREYVFEEEEEEEDPIEEEEDPFPSGGVDLRSKLKNRRQKQEQIKDMPSLTIEVREDW